MKTHANARDDIVKTHANARDDIVKTHVNAHGDIVKTHANANAGCAISVPPGISATLDGVGIAFFGFSSRVYPDFFMGFVSQNICFWPQIFQTLTSPHVL